MINEDKNVFLTPIAGKRFTIIAIVRLKMDLNNAEFYLYVKQKFCREIGLILSIWITMRYKSVRSNLTWPELVSCTQFSECCPLAMHCDTNLVTVNCGTGALFYFEMVLITIWSLMTEALHQTISFTINSTLFYRHAPNNGHFETARWHNVRELRVESSQHDYDNLPNSY